MFGLEGSYTRGPPVGVVVGQGVRADGVWLQCEAVGRSWIAREATTMNTEQSNPGGTLPTITTSLSDADVISRLLSLSKKGKLAGFVAGGAGLFEAEAYGTMFDHRLIARREGEALRFEVRPVWKLPIIFGVVLLLAIGPGLWLTHSMMVTYFSWYTLSFAWTAVWYEILTIVPLPWYIKREWSKSRAAAMEHARETIPRIEVALSTDAASKQV